MSASDRPVVLGVDTGGTYTDAVLYDEDRRAVLGKAKAPTDHDRLAVGIRAAVDGALEDADLDPDRVVMVAVSVAGLALMHLDMNMRMGRM